MHICVSKLTIIGSDNGLWPNRLQSIIWTNVGISLIQLLGINFGEILIGIQTFSFKKMYLLMSCAKCQPFCLGLNVLILNQPLDVIVTFIWLHIYYIPCFNEVEKGVYWFHLVRLSIYPSVCLWTESCLLCIFNNTCWIHFIFTHLI